MSIQIGNLPLRKPSQLEHSRLSVLLWGAAGCGKTTLACTAPGKKLIINLDPDGPNSVTYRGDVDYLDLSALSTDDVLKHLKSDNNPLGLDKYFKEENEKTATETVILDSVTMLSQRALESAVKEGIGKSPRFTPTMETPGLSAYGGRNAILLTCIKGLLRVTGRHNKNLIIVSHEDEPKTNDQGEVLYISMMLGGKLVGNITPNIGEIWWLQDAGKKHRLAIKPCRSRKPMKTRMFVTDDLPEFEFSYKPEDWKNPKNNPIASWYKSWSENKGRKLTLPK